jgi:formylglycine-generating enzyme required for sulfatase activity/tRNA A-37 threonylcarbamoyl transferase component Bud32
LPEEGGRFGPYRVLRELGRGSQGTVFLAEDTRLSRRVALKILPAYRSGGRDRSERFAREAELASRLDHPGLCAVYERGTAGRTAFLAMRYVEGETLSAHLARARRLADFDGRSRAIRLGADATGSERAAIDAVLVLFEKVANALHAAHEANLIHRDVKPGNIVVDRHGEPVLLDFGLARDVDSEVLTLTGDLVGTPAYMSPEQLAAQRIELDRRTDVFSLGATLYECLTLHRPFEAPTRNELYQKILATDPGSPRRFNHEINGDLEVVLLTALDKDRNRRYQTADKFAAELQRVRRHQPILARPAGPILRLRRWAQRNTAVAISLTLVLLALTTGLTFSLYYQARFQQARLAFERLSDFTELTTARREAAGLRPAWPAQIAAMETWLRRYGRPLRQRLAEHQRSLEELRARALPYTVEMRSRDQTDHPLARELHSLREELETFELGAAKAENELVRNSLSARAAACRQDIARSQAELARLHVYTFADRNEQTAHDELTRLVDELAPFTGPRGMYTRIEADLEWAQNVERRSIGDYQPQWRQAQDAIRAASVYGNRQLAPQPGLLPLGLNKQGFQEFAHLRSGKIPARDPQTGALLVDGETGIVFVLVPAKTFTMGRGLRTRRPYEWAPHEVEIDWFFLSKYELSQGQWQRLAGNAATAHDLMVGGVWQQPEYPVQHVSWDECAELLHDHGLQLPTEAQWERAALTTLSTLPALAFTRQLLGNFRDHSHAEAFGVRGPRFDDEYALTAPVDKFQPNDLGIFNMFGNVAEWCREYFAPIPLDYVKIEPVDGLHHLPRTNYRAVRGGAFDTNRNSVGVSLRTGRIETGRDPQVGVRPVRAVR